MRAHAILLDAAHRLRLVNGTPFGVDVPAGERPLAALAAAAPQALGRALEVSLGFRVVGGDAWCAVVDLFQRAG